MSRRPPRAPESLTITTLRACPCVLRMALLALHLLVAGGTGSGAARAQGEVPSARARPERALKIGYLIQGSDLGTARPVMEELRAALLARPDLGRAMRTMGYNDIRLRSCDSPADMIQRLGTAEFEAAFATSVIYSRQFRYDAPTDDPLLVRFREPLYEPVLQFRFHDSDFIDPSGYGVFRHGVVFIGPGSSLWGVPKPTIGQIRQELERSPLAVPDSQSAAGYIFPQLEIRRRFRNINPRGHLFCRSSEEVVKHVVSGLAPVGACELRVLQGPLAARMVEGNSVPLYREVFRTTPVPTDAVLIRAEFHPRYLRGGGGVAAGAQPVNSSALLGLELRAGIETFFNGNPGGVPGLRVERATRRSYEHLAHALRLFDEVQAHGPVRGAISPGGIGGGDD